MKCLKLITSDTAKGFCRDPRGSHSSYLHTTAPLGSPGPPAGELFFCDGAAGRWVGWGGGGGWLGVMTWVECDYSHFARSSLGGLKQSCDMMDLVPEYKEV